MRVCIVGASGKLSKYMVRHALDRGYEVVAICREQSVHKFSEFQERITFILALQTTVTSSGKGSRNATAS
jgi:putative NADH-flavin reductase